MAGEHALPADPSRALSELLLRFFPHVSRACQWMRFDTLDTVVCLLRRTATSAGLRTMVHFIRRAYAIDRQLAADFKKT